ncbi:Zinc finger CCCH-type [Penicillium sp. DV-2018c]|nr:Zinc finger CCCH-type [Penicillium sp. DV-2018c]
MEQSAQNPMQGSLPSDYWHTLDAAYPDPEQHLSTQPQHQAPQQHDSAPQPSPLGIGWDHPVFQQQQREIAPRPDSNHGIYSSLHQWPQSNPLQQPPQRAYGTPPQYQTPPQAPQFQQGQMAFDSRPLGASESSAFPTYSYQQNYFHPSHPQMSVPETFTEAHTQQRLQPRAPQQQPQPLAPTYSLPQGYSAEMMQNTIDLTQDYPASDPNVTINPQFLDSPSQAFSQQQSSLTNNYLQGISADFQRSGNEQSRLFNYYQNNLSVQPQMAPTGNQVISSTPTGLRVPNIQTANNKAAPKKGKTKKTGPKKATSKSESESSSESELEIEEPDEPSPIPPIRPTDSEAAAQYDTLQAVWSPRNKWPGPEKVKNALVAYKDVVKALRDAWKDQVQAMKSAENEGDNDKATKLKEKVMLQRRTMDKIATTTLDMGHPNIVEKLGEHPMIVSALYSFLLDRFQAADYAGSLTINLLKVLSRFSTLTEDLMQKTNLSKLLPKFVKKGGQEVKDLTQQILDNAAACTKRKQENEKPAKEVPQVKGPSATQPKADAGLKRPREADGNLQAGTKRMAVPTTNLKDASKVAPTVNGPTKGTQSSKPASAAALRPKANVVAPKPTSLFGTLSSASKRPGTTNADRAAAAAAAAKPKYVLIGVFFYSSIDFLSSVPAEKEKAPAPKPAFSFGDIMADLNKPKQAPTPKPTEDQPPETEAERQKRLRKEARRKLRVSWKADDVLTEVRLFTHDPDEELGPGDGSLRGLGDIKGEGSVLKLHKDMDELEEEDLGGIRETVFQDDYNLSSKLSIYIDLSLLLIMTAIDFDFDEPKDSSFIKRGGPQLPTSPEKEAQELRESTTLMVFYTSPADMPDTPKEPPAPDSDEVVPEVVPFGEPPDSVKARQERYYAYVNPKPATPIQTQQPAPGNMDISNLLKLIQTVPGQAQPQPIPPPPVTQPGPLPDLERTINMFRQQPQPQAPQPPQIPISQPQGLDFNAILNVMKQMQTPAAFPQQTPAMAPNLGAMFAQFGGQNQNQHASVPFQRQGYDYEDPERKRGREGGYYDENPSSEWSRSKRTKVGANEPKPYKVGLVPCRFWAEGKCRKGDNCTFRHDPL